MVAAIALTAGLVLVMGGAGGSRLSPSSDVAETERPTTAADLSAMAAAEPIPPVTQQAEAQTDEILSGEVEADLEPVGPMTTTSTTAPETTPTTAPSKSSPTTTVPRQSPTTTKPPSTTTTTTPSGGFRSDMEADFLSRINAYRAASGLGALTANTKLNSRARDWSRRMADNGNLSHSNLVDLLPPWSAAGENVGRGNTVESLFNALVNSPPHRSNMLGNFTHVGIGVWVAADGILWTTHVFTR